MFLLFGALAWIFSLFINTLLLSSFFLCHCNVSSFSVIVLVLHGILIRLFIWIISSLLIFFSHFTCSEISLFRLYHFLCSYLAHLSFFFTFITYYQSFFYPFLRSFFSDTTSLNRISTSFDWFTAYNRGKVFHLW